MRIAIISDWFSEKMGYAENCLPKALAALGHEVHLITSDGQVYFNSPTYAETYEPFLGRSVVPCEVKQWDGYTLHRLPHGSWRNRLRIRGLLAELARVRPQIVQTFEVTNVSTYEAALGKLLFGYKLFLESHIHASVYRPRSRGRGLRGWLGALREPTAYGPLLSRLSEKCYPISVDAAELAVRYFGVQQSKIELAPLGVDTALFHPAAGDPAARESRGRLRQELGFSPDEIVCIYTGRFAGDKGPQCLAEAVASLVAAGYRFGGLFVGSGTSQEVAQIASSPGCLVRPFVPFRDLPPYYWAADIAVWPRQESTSQLDAAACGLPIILSDRVQARERIEGNGLTYAEGDAADLAARLLELADPELRRTMGEYGATRIRERYGWDRIARQRATDYQAALG